MKGTIKEIETSLRLVTPGGPYVSQNEGARKASVSDPRDGWHPGGAGGHQTYHMSTCVEAGRSRAEKTHLSLLPPLNPCWCLFLAQVPISSRCFGGAMYYTPGPSAELRHSHSEILHIPPVGHPFSTQVPF